jgi:hypothetical protein
MLKLKGWWMHGGLLVEAWSIFVVTVFVSVD